MILEDKGRGLQGCGWPREGWWKWMRAEPSVFLKERVDEEAKAQRGVDVEESRAKASRPGTSEGS